MKANKIKDLKRTMARHKRGEKTGKNWEMPVNFHRPTDQKIGRHWRP